MAFFSNSAFMTVATFTDLLTRWLHSRYAPFAIPNGKYWFVILCRIRQELRQIITLKFKTRFLIAVFISCHFKIPLKWIQHYWMFEYFHVVAYITHLKRQLPCFREFLHDYKTRIRHPNTLFLTTKWWPLQDLNLLIRSQWKSVCYVFP